MPKTSKPRPTQLVVGPLVYSIDYELQEGEKFGEADHIAATISVRSDLSEYMIKETLMHELLHCIWFICGVSEVKKKKEETVVSLLSPWVLMAMSDPINREFVEYVIQ